MSLKLISFIHSLNTAPLHFPQVSNPTRAPFYCRHLSFFQRKWLFVTSTKYTSCVIHDHSFPLWVSPRKNPNHCAATNLSVVVAEKADFPKFDPAIDTKMAFEALKAKFASTYDPNAYGFPKSPNSNVVTDDMLLWFLKDRRYNVEDAETKLRKYISWAVSLDKIPVEVIQPELDTGKVYYHDSRDVKNRPVFVVRAKRHIANEFPSKHTEKLIKSFLDDIIHDLKDDTSDTVLCLVDLRGFGLRNADTNLIFFFIEVFFNYYPRRLSELVFVDAPLIFQPTWQLLKPLLRSYAKIVVFKSVKDVPKYFTAAENIPKDFL